MITIRQLLFLVSAVASSAAFLSAQVEKAPGSKPNILFLFADDLSYETIGAFGLTDIDTPNLDRLVSRGTTFTHAYNMGSWSGAVCVASRTMLITGRSVWKANAVYNATDKEREAERLWPQHMKKAGYATYFTGKWHLKTDVTKVFDVAKNVRGGMPKDTKEAYNRPLPGEPDPWSASDPQLGGFWEGGKHWSEVVADDTLEFLKATKKAANPLFMYIAFNAAHDPRQSPGDFLDLYPLERIAVPPNFLPEYPFKDLIGCQKGLRDENLAPFPRTEESVKVHRKEYYALISHMDAQIGRILGELEKTGQADNTWIFFTADHGLAVGHHGLFGKQNMYDHSLRVPFIVSGPGVKQGSQTNAPVYLQDVMPTTLALAGVKQPDYVNFQSILPLLGDAPSTSQRKTIYGAYLDLQRAVIHEGWKLMLYPKAKVARLYDLTNDPMEMKDLSADPAQASRMKQLFTLFIEQQKELADPLNLTPLFPALQ